MAKKYQSFPGMEDLLPGEIEKWQWLEEKARIFFEAQGFKEIRTPVLEPTELFARSIGEASDIVHKEMYTFEDRGGRSMTMRPEMTASVARAVIEKGLLRTHKGLRFYYFGPMFRADRPQAGRRRQFHQIGIEMINETGFVADFEVIRFLYRFLDYVGVKNPLLRLNDLGEPVSRKGLTKGLMDYFSKRKSALCKDCQWRLEKNVLRIFDCKVKTCQPVVRDAPWEALAPFSKGFEALQSRLRESQIPFEIDRRLVRGLDYYNGAVFEATAKGLGAQDAVAGGGRYDELYSQLGESKVPCTGFSLGVERLLMALSEQGGVIFEKMKQRKVYLAPLGSTPEIVKVLDEKALELRSRGIRLETTPGQTSLSKHLKKANQAGVRFAVILGPDEISTGRCLVKDLEGKKQTEQDLDGLTFYLERMLFL